MKEVINGLVRFLLSSFQLFHGQVKNDPVWLLQNKQKTEQNYI